MKKVLALLVAMVLCLTLFTSCGDDNKLATKNDKDLDGTVVAEINGTKITQAYYNFIYSVIYNQMAQYEQYYGEDWINMEIEEGKTISQYIAESAKSQVEQLAATIELAKKYDIKVDSKVKEEVETQKKQVVESYNGEEGYIAFLEEVHTTDAAITNYLETYVVLNALFEKITAEGEEGYIEDSEIEKLFNEEYKDKLRVQHVLIATQEDPQTGEPGKSDEEALKIAKEVIAKLDKGESFDDLITEYGEDPGMTAGQFYTFGEGEMVESFEKASKDLKVGQYTKAPVKSDYGYHVIKKYAIDKTTTEYENFKVMKLQENLTELLIEKSKDLKTKWEDKVIDAYLEKWNKEREEAKKAAEDEAATETESETETE